MHGVAARLVFIRKALVDAANPEDGDGSSGKRGYAYCALPSRLVPLLMLTNHTSRFVCSHPHLHSRNGGKASRHRRKSNLVLSLVTHGVLFQFPHAHTHARAPLLAQSNASDASFGGGLSPGRGSDGSVEDTPLGYGNFAMMDTLAGLVGANPLNVRVPSAAAASAANGMGAAGGAGGATPMAGAVGDRSRSAAMPSGVPQPPPSFTVTPLSITTNLTSMTPVPGSRLFVPTARPARYRRCRLAQTGNGFVTLWCCFVCVQSAACWHTTVRCHGASRLDSFVWRCAHASCCGHCAPCCLSPP